MGANIFGKKFPLCILLWDLHVYDKIVIFKFFSSQIFKNYHFYHKVFCQIELKLESTSQKNKYMFKGILVYFLILNKLGQITLCAYLDLCVHLFFGKCQPCQPWALIRVWASIRVTRVIVLYIYWFALFFSENIQVLFILSVEYFLFYEDINIHW